MPHVCLYFLPTGGALISFCTALAVCLWLRSGLQKKIKDGAIAKGILSSFDKKMAFANLWEEWRLEKEIGSLIDKQLDHLIVAFKEQIPMIPMFLTKVREDKLKEQAHIELIKLIPGIKQHLLDRLDTNENGQIDLNASVNEHVDRIWQKLSGHLFKKLSYTILIKASILGFALGLIEAGLMIIICG